MTFGLEIPLPTLNFWTFGGEFLKSEFSVRHVLKLICKSRTYQLSVKTNKWNVDDQINFSHASARRLPAETLLDAIYVVTGSNRSFRGSCGDKGCLASRFRYQIA